MLGAGMMVLLSAGSYGLQRSHWVATQQQVQQLQMQLTQQQAILQAPIAVPEKVHAWVDPGLLTWVLGQVVEKADAAGVVVEDATFGEKMQLPPLQGYPLTVIVRGDFAGLLAFTKSVGQFEKLVGITSLEWRTQWQGHRTAGQLYLEAKLMFVGMPQALSTPVVKTNVPVRAPSFKYRGFVLKAEQQWGILEKEGKTCVLVKIKDLIEDWTVVALDTTEITLALTQSENLSFKLKLETKN